MEGTYDFFGCSIARGAYRERDANKYEHCGDERHTSAFYCAQYMRLSLNNINNVYDNIYQL